MAVYAAHLTRTLHGAPSVFAVVAQDALGATVKPALRKLVEYLAAAYPGKCGWWEHWYDELYLLLDLCLQYHYLKHYAASFSESFYGLLRVPVSGPSEFNSGQRLPPRLERASLLMLVLLPYLRDKAERLAARWREDRDDGRLGKSVSERARRAAVTAHAAAHFACAGAKLVQLARYVAGGSGAPTPALLLLGLALRHAPPRQEHESWSDVMRSIFIGDIGGAGASFPLLGSALLRGAQYGAFGVQFLRWWESRGALDAALAAPPPPPPQRDARAVRHSNKCPLCRRAWRTPAALPVSGYIFCYTCISRHLRADPRCPVTRCPAAEHSLVRLYLNN